MRILYISQYFPPECCAPAARVSELARRWAQAGHKVTVLTGFPNHPSGVVPPEYRAKLRRLVCRENFDGVNVIRTWLLPLRNGKALERMINYSSFLISSSLTGTWLRHMDVVIATSPQLLVGLAGWWTARIHGARFVFEVRDLWPESFACLNGNKGGSLVTMLLGKISRFLYRNCDHLVVVTAGLRDRLRDKYGIPESKISVVENAIETDTFAPGGDEPELRERLSLNGDFAVSYIGTLGFSHGLRTLLQAAQLIEHQLPQVVFLLVGDGAERRSLVDEAQRLGLQNVRFLPLQPRDTVPAFIRASNACVVLLKDAEIFHSALPTKILESMACGRPVVAAVDGVARQMLNDSGAGLFVKPEDPVALTSAIKRLFMDPELCRTLGANGRHYVLEHFGRQNKAEAYSRILERVFAPAARFSAVHPPNEFNEI